MSTAQGPAAKLFTTQWLQSNQVSLDIDDKSRTDNYGRFVAVVYLVKPDGSLVNFNRMLVDQGHACIWDFSNNEFNPADWWGGSIPAGTCSKSDSSVTTTSSGAFTALGGASTVGTEIFNFPPSAERDQYSSNGSPQPGDTGHTYSGYNTGNSYYGSTGSSYASSSNGPFVGSSKSNKYHYPSCSAAKKIKSSNLVTFSSSAEARAAGYVPCKICCPP